MTSSLLKVRSLPIDLDRQEGLGFLEVFIDRRLYFGWNLCFSYKLGLEKNLNDLIISRSWDLSPGASDSSKLFWLEESETTVGIFFVNYFMKVYFNNLIIKKNLRSGYKLLFENYI